MRDFAAELRDVRFWDAEVSTSAALESPSPPDIAVQNREEIIALCEWIEATNIRSYLEIGIWTGRLINVLHRIFKFKTAAGCDLGGARLSGLSLKLERGVDYFEGNSLSPIFVNWRKRLGPIDLTLIDSSHDYKDIKKDLQINASFPSRYIALHGIAGGQLVGDGVQRCWNELGGDKFEILRPHTAIGKNESTMGIGIWRNPKCR